MHREKYWSAKVPVALAVIYALNLLLVIALEIMMLYPSSLPLTPDSLADFDSSYENCQILMEAQQSKLYCCLAETAEGEIHLVPLREHGFASSRGRILKKHITVINKDTESIIPVKIGVHTSQITVSPEPPPYMEPEMPAELYISIDYFGGTSGTLYMVLAGILAVLELGLWELLKQNLR